MNIRNYLTALLLVFSFPVAAQNVQQSGSITNNHAVKWITNGVVGDGGLGFTSLVNGNFSSLLNTTGHIADTGSTPALSSCGTSPAISGTDLAGQVTMGTASPTGCTITFANAYVSAPFCVVTWQTNIASMQYTISTTAITLVQTGTSSNKVNYMCRAPTGG
jgi:hypothetical protein